MPSMYIYKWRIYWGGAYNGRLSLNCHIHEKFDYSHYHLQQKDIIIYAVYLENNILTINIL